MVASESLYKRHFVSFSIAAMLHVGYRKWNARKYTDKENVPCMCTFWEFYTCLRAFVPFVDLSLNIILSHFCNHSHIKRRWAQPGLWLVHQIQHGETYHILYNLVCVDKREITSIWHQITSHPEIRISVRAKKCIDDHTNYLSMCIFNCHPSQDFFT